MNKAVRIFALIVRMFMLNVVAGLIIAILFREQKEFGNALGFATGLLIGYHCMKSYTADEEERVKQTEKKE